MTTPTPHSAFPGALWPAVPQPAGGALLAILGQLEQSQFVAPEQLLRVRRPQLEALLDHSEAALPFWQARLQEVGLDRASRGNAALDQRVWDERWARLPLLTRPEVQAEGDGLRINELPKGHGDIGESVTSGSSGRPKCSGLMSRSTSRLTHKHCLRNGAHRHLNQILQNFPSAYSS